MSRNNYGLRCSVVSVAALHLYPPLLTRANILVRIGDEAQEREPEKEE